MLYLPHASHTDDVVFVTGMKYSYAPISVSKPSFSPSIPRKRKEKLSLPVVSNDHPHHPRVKIVLDLLRSDNFQMKFPSTTRGHFLSLPPKKLDSFPERAFRQRSLVTPRAGRSRFYARIAFQVMLIREEAPPPSPPGAALHPSREFFNSRVL